MERSPGSRPSSLYVGCVPFPGLGFLPMTDVFPTQTQLESLILRCRHLQTTSCVPMRVCVGGDIREERGGVRLRRVSTGSVCVEGEGLLVVQSGVALVKLACLRPPPFKRPAEPTRSAGVRTAQNKETKGKNFSQQRGRAAGGAELLSRRTETDPGTADSPEYQ